MPGSDVFKRYEAIVGPLVGPFRGTAMALVHLYASPKSGLYGLHTPLKNLWAWSMCTLGNKFDLPSLHNSTDTTIPGLEILDDIRWMSMRISFHIAASARDLVNFFPPIKRGKGGL